MALVFCRFTDWSSVVEWTTNSPREVLALLIKAGDFKTAKSWCRLQKLSEAIRLVTGPIFYCKNST